MQAACIVPREKYGSRLVFGLAASSICVFIYLSMVVYFDYIQYCGKAIYVDDDVKTITAADYSVELNISKE